MFQIRKSPRLAKISVVLVILGVGTLGWFLFAQTHLFGINKSSALFAITDSGSTNTLGWTITVNNDGSGTRSFASGPRPDSADAYNYRNIDLADKQYPAGFFDVNTVKGEIRSYGDITNLGGSGCIKSASFGSEEYLTVGDKTSKDISCSTNDSASQTLINDVYTVIKPAEKDVNL